MRIDASERSLQELFSGFNTFSIPDYQRNYAWKSDQIDAYLEDIFSLTDGVDEQHFFGPIVVLDDGHGSLTVIDGQQRLTTTVMFLALIRDQLDSFEDKDVVVNGHHVSLEGYLTQILKHDDFIKDRYVANHQIKHVFSTHILMPPGSAMRKTLSPGGAGLSDDEKAATRELRGAYKRLKAKIVAFLLPNAGDEDAMKAQLHDLILVMRNKFRLLEIKMYSEDDAYIFFETLNARGLPLTASDLLKNLTLRRAKSDNAPDLSDVLNTWDQAVSKLGGYDFTKFLRHYLLSAQDKKVQAKKIFKLFNDIIDSYGVGGAVKNLNELNKAAGVYAQLLSESFTFGDAKLDACLKRLNLFSETHRVFLLRVMLKNFSAPAKLRAARATEILAFRWILTGGNAQELETLYQNAAKSLIDDDDETLKSAVTALLSKLPTDDAVRNTIIDSPARRDLQFYVLKKLNYAITGAELVWPNQSIHIEHLAPQRPELDSNWFDRVAPRTAADPNTPTYEDYVGRWGNLSLLEFEINQSIQNSEWDVKLVGLPANAQQGLNDSAVRLTIDVRQAPEWTADLIDKRTKWIADAVVTMSAHASVDTPPAAQASFTLTPGA